MTIHVADYIKTAFSVDDAKEVNTRIEQALTSDSEIILDFTGVTFFTTYFFSSSIMRYINDFGPEKFDEVFSVTGLTEVGQTAYSHSLEFAREEYLLTPEQKKARLNAIMSDLNEDL